VYQLPGVSPLVYEAVLARTMLNKYIMLFDHYLDVQSSPPAPLAPSVSLAFFGAGSFGSASSSPPQAAATTNQHVQQLKAQLRNTATLAQQQPASKSSWW
jgi:hypothetical protein